MENKEKQPCVRNDLDLIGLDFSEKGRSMPATAFILPCVVGDEIYHVIDRRIYPKRVVAISVFISDHIRSIEIQAENGRGAITSVHLGDFGVNVFLYRDDAEDEVTARMNGRRCYVCDYWTPGDPRCLCDKSQWFLDVVQPDNYCGQFVARNIK